MAAPVAVVTDLWPSRSDPSAGRFVRDQVAATEREHVVLVPRLRWPRVHAAVWGRAVNGWQRGWEDGPLEYRFARVPRRGETGSRVRGLHEALRGAHVRPALVHGHFLLGAGAAAVGLARGLGVPSVVTGHGTDVRWLDEPQPPRVRAELLAAASGADHVIAVSDELRAVLERHGVDASRITVVPMGFDASVFHLRDRRAARAACGVGDEPVVAFVGRAVPEKGTEVLRAALAGLDGVRAVHAGSGEAAGLEALGVLTPEQLALWLAAADVLCLPSEAEGAPVSVVEALAVGTPVVASAVGAIPEQVDEGSGVLVPPRDPAALADALRSALARSWDHAAIAARAARFSAAASAARVETVYEELLA